MNSSFITRLGTRLKQEQLSINSDASARLVLLLPTIFIVLVLSIFPLIVSSVLSFTSVTFVRGGINVRYMGLANYNKLLFGSQQRHLIGKLENPSLIGWLVFILVSAVFLSWFYTEIRNKKLNIIGFLLRIVAVVGSLGLAWITVSTLFSPDGLPGTMVVTLFFVVAGVMLQYTLGLMLAMLLIQNIPGKRFFRIIFLLPMMITPVGIAFLFRMVTDTHVGPLAPIWTNLGMTDFSWLETANGARLAVLIGDTWQWTPFMFIILLAALEGTSREQLEAAMVDGANRLRIFRYIILPQITPVSLTLILIRLIEAFKIIDIPRILTGGGPGTATESLTLHAFIEWRAPNLGGSSAISYLLLILVTFVVIIFVNVIRQQILERL
jgi:multiple sugar transport system permease protein